MGASAANRDSVAIIGAGEMGTAVGRHLSHAGVRVLTEVKGRSPQSAQRVSSAGLEVIDDDARLVSEANYLLSIVPPAVAREVAERFCAPLKRANPKPLFVECNAVSPATVLRIEALLAETGCSFVDAGIIGGPPPIDNRSRGPRFYASGPAAKRFADLTRYGLDIAVLDAPVGAASSLKLSYAGLTKGFTALGAAMIHAASREGLADALKAELARTQPDMLARLERFIPAMFPKAYRWIEEMNQIAEFAGKDGDGAGMYRGAAHLYERIASEFEKTESGLLSALATFCGKYT